MKPILHLVHGEAIQQFAASPNRSASASLSEVHHLDSTPLIDTIRVVGTISRHFISHWNIHQGVDSNGEVWESFTSAGVRLDGVTLGVRHSRLRGLEAVMELSVPTYLRGHNLHPATVGETRTVLGNLHNEAAEYVDWIENPSQLRINRLDLDRGFDDVQHVHRLLTGLGRLHVPRTANPRLYYDKNHSGALTLERRTARTWRAILYDKSTQMATLARRERDPQRRAHLQRAADQCIDHLRYELQLRSETLRRAGVTTMADLDEQILLGLRKDYFQRARFDNPVGGASRLEHIQTALALAKDRDYKAFGAVLAMLRAEALGLPQPMTSPVSLARYRRLAQKWGLSAADVLTEAGPPVALDYATGTVRAA